MATIGYAQIPVPGGGDAPAGPGALAAMAQVIDPRLLQHVVDQAERDATYADAPLHTAVTAEDGTLWIKTSATANTWATVYEPDPAWRPISPSTGYQGGAYPPEVRRIGNLVWLRGRIEPVDENAVIPTNGVKVGDVPADCIPQTQVGSIAANSSLAGDVIIGVGKLEILDAGTASSLGDPGSITWWSQDGATAAGTPWINISGSYWID